MPVDTSNLKTKILAEDAKAKKELLHKLKDPHVSGNVGCIDSKTQFKGDWNPPASAQFIDRQDKLEDWMETKRSGTFGIHVGCAGQYFAAGLTSERARRQAIANFQAKVADLNTRLGTDFKVKVEEVGSARDLLSKRKQPSKLTILFAEKLCLFGFLSIVVVLLAGLTWIKFNYSKPAVSPPNQTKVATQSSTFSQAILEAKQKAEEEAKKKEEERQYIATYGPCYWVPILMYHHIDGKSGWLYIDPQTFASQMDYLVGKGYTSVTLAEVVNYLSSGQVPAKIVAITFDDGYRDIFSNAYSILRSKNIKATVFLITQLMEGSDYLTWEQVREMAGSGLITLGDHTLSHRSLASLPEDQIKDEIFSSKRIIEEKTGVKTTVFAYPYGSYNNTVIKYLNEAGFMTAVTTQSGNSCAKLPLALRRLRVGRGSLSSYGL